MKGTLLVAGLVLLMGEGASAIDSIAHRGFSSAFPGNTLQSIDEAWKTGAAIVEVDVRLLADGTLVLFHDTRINKEEVSSLTYRQLQDLTPLYHVPTLTEALEHLSKTRRFILDLKDDTPRFHEALSKVLQESAHSSSLIFQSPKISVLKRLQTSFPTAGFMFLTRLDRTKPLNQPPDPLVLANRLSQNGLSGISAKGRQFVDSDYIKVFQDHGLLYYVWTINPADRISHYQKLGVDGIITDYPNLVK